MKPKKKAETQTLKYMYVSHSETSIFRIKVKKLSYFEEKKKKKISIGSVHRKQECKYANISREPEDRKKIAKRFGL